MSAAHPFAALVDLARTAEAAALPLPSDAPREAPWRGLGFQLAGLRMLAALGEVEEVLRVPALTVVPGVKPWLLGVANVRQRLLTLVDLAAYLGIASPENVGERRALVVEDGELYCGLLVDAALGMQAFPADTRVPVERESAALAPYVVDAFQQSGRYWRVMALKRLVREPQFLDTAVRAAE